MSPTQKEHVLATVPGYSLSLSLQGVTNDKGRTVDHNVPVVRAEKNKSMRVLSQHSPLLDISAFLA